MTSTSSSWADDVVPVLNVLFPALMTDSAEPVGVGHVAFMRAYTTAYNLAATSPDPAASCASICAHFESFMAKWASSAHTFIGNDVYRYLSAWNILQSGLPYTERIFSYHNRRLSPETSAEEQAIPTRSAALRQWRLQIISPLFGERGAMRSSFPLIIEGDERQKVLSAVLASFETCGIVNSDPEMAFLVE